ncbi:hypothetical protein B7C51_24255 [Paenibacillus larvae subsp. pulvifaciens]|uniref:Ricin B lectin domain-containing protein n=1 Tax=Paenibacillus larvae subsp. pulvifaciens TaxID=1477 RepID=A0A1V0UYL3_9BACL|nr:RICIN domain-containing protein [Paenibacillus larvae]ARF70287.1 hypothetical protein B7C51_24255 [Paenibacillus larvae subsp. pulvifaciens]
MIQKMNAMLKKTILILLVTILLGGSLVPTQGTIHAQPPDNTNGAKAAVLEWIRELSLELLNVYMARSWPIDLMDSGPNWRPVQVKDENGVVKEDRRQRLLRWDRRPPNQILRDGFIPQVTNEEPSLQDTDLFGYVKSNTKSIFVSTTKTKFKQGKRYQPWTPRSSARGIIYQYEIFAPGGIDVNNSFGDRSPWPNQLEVAFPGGIRPEFIRSVRELHDGRIQRIWINRNFQDPGNLEAISASSRTELVNWYPNHPDGNHKDSNVPDTINSYETFNPDADMYGKNGDVPNKEDIPVFKGPRVLPDGEYQIKSRKDTNVLADLPVNQSGTKIHAHRNTGGVNQKWNFVYDSSREAYKIKSSQNPNLLLTWQSQSGNFIIGYEDHGYRDQYWKIERTGDGYYKLRSFYDTNKLLDLEHGNTSNGTPLYAWQENGATSQEWIIAPTTYRPLKDGQYQIQSSLDLYKVVHLTSDQDDAPVQIYQDYLTINQRWNFTYNAAKRAYKITSPNRPEIALAWDSHHSGKIIGATGDYDDQYWRIEKTSDGYYKLRNYKNPQMVLDVPNSNPSNGVQLQAWGDNGTKAQKWGIIPVINQTIEDGEYLISSRIDPNKVADLTGDNKVVTYVNHNGGNQKWKFTFDPTKQAYRVVNVDRPDMAFAWDSHHSGKIIGAIGDYDDQYWRVYKTSDGYFTLRNYKDPKMVLDVPNSNPNNDVQLQAWGDNGTKAQKWSIQRVDVPIIPEGTYNISSKLNYKKVIDKSNSNAVIWQYLNAKSQDWKFEYDSNRKAYKIRSELYQNQGLYYQGKGHKVAIDNIDSPPDENELRKFWIVEYNVQQGAYLIRSAYDPTQVLDLQYSSLDDGNEIITWDPGVDNNRNQLWNLMPRID